MSRPPKKRCAVYGQNIVPDPLVDPGNPPHRHQACTAAHPTRAHHRMVTLAKSSPSRGAPLPSQKESATVMLAHRSPHCEEREESVYAIISGVIWSSMRRILSRSTSLRFFRRCTWITSDPGDIAKAAIAASRSRCSCCRRANCSRNSRSSICVIATAGLLSGWPHAPAEPDNYRVFHKLIQASRKYRPIKEFGGDLPKRKAGCTVALETSLRYTYLVLEPT